MQRFASAASSASRPVRTKTNFLITIRLQRRPLQSDHKFTVVLAKEDKFMRKLCMNCEDPACASVCPVGALHKTALGPVAYDAHKCMGCRYCMVACPFGVPKYEWNNSLTPK